MDDDEKEWARLDALWRRSWKARCLEIEHQVEEVRKEVLLTRHELGEIGDAISDTLHDLIVATQDVQRLLTNRYLQEHHVSPQYAVSFPLDRNALTNGTFDGEPR